MSKTDYIRSLLSEAGLKITPQRIAVMEAIVKMNEHPTAERIISSIQKTHPNIASGTVYNTLETFVQSNLLRRVKTEKDVMRYDSVIRDHHHLYCEASDRIEDYFDEELDALLRDYFAKKSIPNFHPEELRLQITGRFEEKSKN